VAWDANWEISFPADDILLPGLVDKRTWNGKYIHCINNVYPYLN
jgi:hypothetical protein